VKQRRQRQDLRTNAGLFEPQKKKDLAKNCLREVVGKCVGRTLVFKQKVGLRGFIDKCRDANSKILLVYITKASSEISSQWRIKQEFHLSSELKLLAAKGHSWANLCEYKTKHDRTWGLPKKNNT